MEDDNLLYFFLGDLKSGSPIGDYPSKDSEKFNIYFLFDKISNSKARNNNQRNKVPTSHGVLFYIISTKNIFYSVLSSSNNDDLAFDLINQLMNQDLNMLLNDRGTLSFEGINVLKDLYDKNLNKTLIRVQDEVNEVKSEMSQNIQKAITNIDDVRDLDGKSGKIKDGALLFQEGATEYKRQVWWQNMKFKIFIGCVVVGIIIYIILK